MTTCLAFFDSPIGRLTLVARDGALAGVYFPDHARAPAFEALEAKTRPDEPILRRAAGELAEYFEHRRTRFDLPLATAGTAFQRSVWSALVEVPFGATTTYGELARDLGRPSAVRAVGAANARNPLSIVVPCHRVVGSDGELTGYAGGLAVKRWLLEHERAHALRPDRASLS